MGTELLPKQILLTYEVHEWKHACAILATDFPSEWKDITDLLSQFYFKKSWIEEGGGRKSKVSSAIDEYLYKRDWVEKEFKTSFKVDESVLESPTHNVDCYKNKVALEI